MCWLHALAQGQRTVLGGVVVVHVQIALVVVMTPHRWAKCSRRTLHVRVTSKRACLASAVSMWSRKPMPASDGSHMMWCVLIVEGADL